MIRASTPSERVRSKKLESKPNQEVILMELKTFDKWSVAGITVSDPGLVRYINIDPRIVPRTGARYAGKKFYKSRTFIVERLMNKLMIPGHKGKKHNKTSGHCTGKSSTVYNIVKDTFEQVEKKTKENPIKVFVKALENAAPREEVISIEYGGARYPKALECAPQRRVDIALRYMVQGAYAKSFNSRKGIVAALADEIVYAYTFNGASQAISKKQELERQADASR